MKKWIGALVLLIVAVPWKGFAQELSLTVDEAVAIALRENRDILLKRQDIEKAKAKISEAKADLFPSLNATGNWNYTQGYFSKDITQASTQLTLKQYLYKGGKTQSTIQKNEYAKAIADAILDKTKLELVLKVKETFYTFLLALDFSRLNKGILENALAHQSSVEARFKNGQASESDVLQMQESVSNVTQVYEISLNQVDSAQSFLKNLLFLNQEVAIVAEGKFVYEPVDSAYEESFLKAMRMRPEIRQYEAQEKQSRASVNAAKADSRPQVYASWDYYSRSTTSLVSLTPTKGWQDYHIAGVTFTWPLFDGWSTKAKVDQALVDLKEAQILREKAVKDIALELKNAYLQLKDALEKVKTAQTQLQVYKDALSIREARYKAGMASSLELDDASLGYRVAEFAQTQAAYEYSVAKTNFDKATGGF